MVAATIASPALVRASTINLELCLLFDCSGSMYGRNGPGLEYESGIKPWRIQRDGHIAALLDPEVTEALVWRGGVRVKCFIWSDTISQISDHRILSAGDIKRVATSVFSKIPEEQPSVEGTNHVAALRRFSTPPESGRRVVDISTNEYPKGEAAAACSFYRDIISSYGGTVNVLSVDEGDEVTGQLSRHVQTIDGFTEKSVGWSGYHRAIKRKLLGEIV